MAEFDINIARAFEAMPSMMMNGAGPSELLDVVNTGEMAEPMQFPDMGTQQPGLYSSVLMDTGDSGMAAQFATAAAMEQTEADIRQSMVDELATEAARTDAAASSAMMVMGPAMGEYPDTEVDEQAMVNALAGTFDVSPQGINTAISSRKKEMDQAQGEVGRLTEQNIPDPAQDYDARQALTAQTVGNQLVSDVVYGAITSPEGMDLTDDTGVGGNLASLGPPLFQPGHRGPIPTPGRQLSPSTEEVDEQAMAQSLVGGPQVQALRSQIEAKMIQLQGFYDDLVNTQGGIYVPTPPAMLRGEQGIEPSGTQRYREEAGIAEKMLVPALKQLATEVMDLYGQLEYTGYGRNTGVGIPGSVEDLLGQLELQRQSRISEEEEVAAQEPEQVGGGGLHIGGVPASALVSESRAEGLAAEASGLDPDRWGFPDAEVDRSGFQKVRSGGGLDIYIDTNDMTVYAEKAVDDLGALMDLPSDHPVFGHLTLGRFLFKARDRGKGPFRGTGSTAIERMKREVVGGKDETSVWEWGDGYFELNPDGTYGYRGTIEGLEEQLGAQVVYKDEEDLMRGSDTGRRIVGDDEGTGTGTSTGITSTTGGIGPRDVSRYDWETIQAMTGDPTGQYELMRAREMGEDIYKPRQWRNRMFGYQPVWDKFLLSGREEFPSFVQETWDQPEAFSLVKGDRWDELADVSRSLRETFDETSGASYTPEQLRRLNTYRGYLAGSDDPKNEIISLASAGLGGGVGIGAQAMRSGLSQLYDIFELRNRGTAGGADPGGFIAWLDDRMKAGNLEQ